MRRMMFESKRRQLEATYELNGSRLWDAVRWHTRVAYCGDSEFSCAFHSHILEPHHFFERISRSNVSDMIRELVYVRSKGSG
jgi:hypothetical protein